MAQNIGWIKQVAKNRVWKFFWYSKREEAAWPLFFFSILRKSRPSFLQPIFSTPHFGYLFFRMANWPIFSKSSVLRLTSRMLIIIKMSINFPGQCKLSKKISERGKFSVIASFFRFSKLFQFWINFGAPKQQTQFYWIFLLLLTPLDLKLLGASKLWSGT